MPRRRGYTAQPEGFNLGNRPSRTAPCGRVGVWARGHRARPNTVSTCLYHVIISRPFRANRLRGWFPRVETL
jgi:hypothetical protein